MLRAILAVRLRHMADFSALWLGPLLARILLK